MAQVHRPPQQDGDAAPLLAAPTSQPPPRSSRQLRVIVALALAFVLGNVLFLQRSVLVKQTQLLANHDAVKMLKDAWGMAGETELTEPQPVVIKPKGAPGNASSSSVEQLDNKTLFAMNLWSVSEQRPQQQRGIVLPLFDKIATLGLSLILQLRAMGVDLPIEVPHCGDLDQKYETQLLKRDPLVRVYDVCDLAASYKTDKDERLFCHELEHCHVRFRGFDIKVISVVLSRFDEVMLMDADTLYFRSPMPLWDSEQYRTTGTFFFNDRVAQEHTFLGRYVAKSSPKVTGLQDFLSRFDVTPFRFVPTLAQSFASEGPAAEARAKGTVVPLGFKPSDFLLTSHSWNRRSGHQVDSSLLLWDKTRQPRATAILASFVSMINTMHPPSYGDKELFFLACELAETAYAFSDVGVGAIGVVRRTYYWPIGKKNPVLCGDAIQFLPTGIASNDTVLVNAKQDAALPLYYNGDHILTWNPSDRQIFRTQSRAAAFYNGSNRERGIPLLCPMDTTILKVSDAEEQRIVQRHTLHESVLQWFE